MVVHTSCEVWFEQKAIILVAGTLYSFGQSYLQVVRSVKLLMATLNLAMGYNRLADAIREDVDEEALVHGEEEAIFQEDAIGNENESGEDIGPEEEQIIIPVPVERYPQRI